MHQSRSDRYVDESSDLRPRRGAQRVYSQDYIPRSSFNYAWIIIPLLSVAVAALSFGVYHLMPDNKPVLAQITAVTPNYTMINKPYNSCHKEATTNYVANQKNGTDGAIIGGTTGALAGREIQRSNQLDYIAKHGSTTKCTILYKMHYDA